MICTSHHTYLVVVYKCSIKSHPNIFGYANITSLTLKMSVTQSNLSRYLFQWINILPLNLLGRSKYLKQSSVTHFETLLKMDFVTNISE